MSGHTPRRDIDPSEARVAAKPPLRRFHQARWDESLIFEQSKPGQRGVLPPSVEPEIADAVGDPAAALPDELKRATPPALPELSQLEVLRHYLRLSQENLGVDFNIDIGQGTCTMKYSPKVNDQLVAGHKLAELHPLQDNGTVQGVLEIFSRMEEMLAEISGMDRVSLQPGAGSAAIWTNVAMVRAYHASRGESHRDEIITTVFSHPSNAACAATAGYKVITLYPDADGYPDLDALKAAVGDRTAALLITNPEDTGIFNPRIEEFVAAVHEVGGLAVYDQANANGILGITRAREAGFDLCHFNLHKTFSTPHACGGPAAGACGVTSALEPFLPKPTVEHDGTRYWLDHDRPLSIGKVRPFLGVAANVVRAYAWIMSLGAEGLREVAETAVLNNNYLLAEMLKIDGVSAPYAEGKHRIEQVRYSWQKLHEDTGVHSEDLGLRAADFGVHYWTSHHPHLVAEPATLEPTESYSKADLDEYVAIMRQVAHEAYTEPETVRTAPHRSTIHRTKHDTLEDPGTWAVTWRAYRRKTATE
ncbi:aminomethyl-transferring glycine dehydrogenase subunit GcvPB [Stackebrandtia nassauensis]|uniref:glycine dehydrogenase (aminomethyl-transferring) n=1 Tax=Stackebrandtia nassauensis (strain DSM 44728 / CIP 108903 / NRRL B-16338 / NBRC 102104 / LLR-40K-21) TaxID=446470 RepID=D3Q7D6_STANL|nr:aminomethyl-transferring glycine dehydrogenase subunit GcvPB [Stackebrandtia nassauensis]ADD42407.1 glycine dehydrogenase subunit 2 [Stackebrandtia nassauensis DSM 44728]